MPDNPLDGKVALITGGARRVGAAISRLLHAQGMKLAIHYLSSEQDAHALQQELNAARADSVILICGDLGQGEPLLKNLVHESVGAFGRLDALINNAARFYATPLGEATETQWGELIDVNLKAPFFLTQAALPHLKHHGGCVVNVADVYADRPLAGFAIYSITKAGLVMLTKALARDAGPEVRVNAVAPGVILWPEEGIDEMSKQRIVSRTPLKRAGDPDDVARAVLYLLRDGGFVTGEVLSVDGGRGVVL